MKDRDEMLLFLERKVDRLENKAIEHRIYYVDKELKKITRILEDLLEHLELESYTEKVDHYFRGGHGIRKRTEEDYD